MTTAVASKTAGGGGAHQRTDQASRFIKFNEDL